MPQEHAVHCMTSPPSASWESPEFGAALCTVKVPALNVSPLATPLFADTPDNLDYGAALAEAPANQAGARQRRIVCRQHLSSQSRAACQ